MSKASLPDDALYEVFRFIGFTGTGQNRSVSNDWRQIYEKYSPITRATLTIKDCLDNHDMKDDYNKQLEFINSVHDSLHNIEDKIRYEQLHDYISIELNKLISYLKSQNINPGNVLDQKLEFAGPTVGRLASRKFDAVGSRKYTIKIKLGDIDMVLHHVCASGKRKEQFITTINKNKFYFNYVKRAGYIGYVNIEFEITGRLQESFNSEKNKIDCNILMVIVLLMTVIDLNKNKTAASETHRLYHGHVHREVWDDITKIIPKHFPSADIKIYSKIYYDLCKGYDKRQKEEAAWDGY
jgi:hypothetical protein